MKVFELIEQLKKYDGNLDVVFYSRDYGSLEATRARSVRVKKEIFPAGGEYSFYKYSAKKCANAVVIE